MLVDGSHLYLKVFRKAMINEHHEGATERPAKRAVASADFRGSFGTRPQGSAADWAVRVPFASRSARGRRMPGATPAPSAQSSHANRSV
jgi:hypothetical protein